MKRIISITITTIIILTLLSAGSAVSAKVSVAAPSIKVANTKKGVRISWKKPKGAKRYIVYRKASGAKKYSVIKKISKAKTVAFTDKKAKTGKKYIYAVKSVNSKASALSAKKSIVRLTAPKSVKYIKAKTTKTSSYTAYEPSKLKWSKVTGAKKYNIYRSEFNGKKWGAYKKIDSVKANSSGEWYYMRSGKYTKFKVSAVSGKSESVLSAATPKYLELDSTSVRVKRFDDGLVIDWDFIGGAQKYLLYRSENEGGFKLLKTLKGEDNIIYSDEAVKKGNYYSYYVIGVKDKVKSEKSDVDVRSSAYYDDCDYAIELGENENDFLSSVYSLLDNLQGSYNKITYKSSDTNVLKVNVTTDGKNTKTVKLEGVSAGYATLTVKSTMDFGDGFDAETTTTKYKIRVQDSPVYMVKMKVGSKRSLTSMAVPSDMNELIELSDNSLKMTSSDESVVKVKTKDQIPYFQGLSAGEATITVKMDIPDSFSGEFDLLKDFSADIKVLVEA